MRSHAEGILPAWAQRTSRFLLAGTSATALHWAVMAALVAAGIDPRPATVCGAFAGAAANYFLQRSITFADRVPRRAAIRRYAIACSIAWAVNLAVFTLLHTVVGLAVAPAQLVTTATVVALAYLLYSKVVFHEDRRR
jgi:putative flippase GtrA